MKKITSLMLAAATMISSAGMSVQAAGRVVEYDKALADGSQIHILYNDRVIEYEDVKPVNTEGRVMIPFRAVLEDMGATVNYDDSQRLVTATKDETQIKFTLMDDTIYIDDNGVKSTITMDVPMIVVDGRTLVPIRFMSNALGMQVGWDGETETVIIMDYENYFANLTEVLPNLTKATELKQPKFNKEYVGFDMFMSVVDGEEKVDFSIGGGAEGTYVDNAAQIDTGVNLLFNGTELNDIELDVVFKDNSVYAKTNLFGKISSLIEGTEIKKNLAEFKDNVWYKVDLKAVLEAMNIPAESMKVFESLATMDLNESVALEDVLETLVTTEGDASFEEALSMAAIADTLELMDKYIKVEEKENDGYSISVDISTSDFLDMLGEFIGEAFTETDKKLIETILDFNVSAVSLCDGNKVESDAKVVFNLDYEGTKVDMTFEFADTVETDSKAKIEEIDDCEDITQKLVELLK